MRKGVIKKMIGAHMGYAQSKHLIDEVPEIHMSLYELKGNKIPNVFI